MPGKKHDRESIIETLQNLARRLGKDTLSTREVQQLLPESSVRNHFGSVGNALSAAGLRRNKPGENFRNRSRKLSNDELFRSVADVEHKLGHLPGLSEYQSNGQFSTRPFKRFGKWSDAMAHYRKWKAEGGAQASGLSVDANPTHQTTTDGSVRQRFAPQFQSHVPPAQLYGEPIDFRGLRHAPINEQGVVYLFGMVSRELGFYIEAIQQGFPDCEGKYLHHAGRNLWAKARIEFEFRASSFREHGHDASQCDFVICWVNDWPDCPIPVIELSKEILKLPAK